MLKIKKITSLLCFLLALLVLMQTSVFADETAAEILDSANIEAKDLYTMQRGEFSKEISGGGCSVVYLSVKELYFNTKEAKFVKFHVENGETVAKAMENLIKKKLH